MKVLGVFWLATISIGFCPLQQVQPLRAKEIAEFKKRAKVEPYLEDGSPKVKVTVDDTCLYDGPGKNGRVEVEANTPLPGQIFVSVRSEGEEVARFWVRSLAKPLKVPPTVMASPEHASYSSDSQSNNGKSACKIELSRNTIYEGPGTEVTHEVVGKGEKQAYSIRVDQEVVYYVPVRCVKVKGDELGTVPRKPGKPEPGQQPSQKVKTPPATGEKAIALVIERLNLCRKGAGLHEVTEDKELSKACLLHAEYLAINPDVVDAGWHREEPDRKGYTEAGAKCAPRSVVQHSPEDGDALQGLDSLIAAPYHRISMLSPQLIKVGIGTAEYGKSGLVFVMDVGTLKWDTRPVARPVLFPYVDQKEVPLEFGGREWPNPLPKEQKQMAGYPITLYCDPVGWKPGEAEATLRCGNDLVPCWLSTPERPANLDRPQPGTVFLIPKAPLKPSTTYTVDARCKQFGIEKTPEWSKSWSFTTAAAEK
jgi:hypothetical protein